MSFLAPIGDYALGKLRPIRHLVAVASSVVALAVQPRSWPRSVRRVLGRQIFFTGVQGLGFILALAFFVGLGLVTQAQFWMSRLGTSEFLGPFLVTVIFREIGPLLVSLVIIGRSGTAIATELGGMVVRQEVKVLDAQGLDPMVYLVMPRVIGLAISVFALTMFFALASLASGYFFARLMGIAPGSVELFLSSILNGLTPTDIINLLAKTLPSGLMIGAICCMEGLGVTYVTEIPQSATRTVVRANTAVFVIYAAVSFATYF
jgi:phospholipid/cholesterol/gamma-HCH transport system permease protein